jgi:hypothetical protein
VALGAITDCAHDRDDLLNRRRISWVLLALVAGWTASVVAGHGRGRAAVPGGVQQHGFHESSLGGVDDAATRITRRYHREAPVLPRALLASALTGTLVVGDEMRVAE